MSAWVMRLKPFVRVLSNRQSGAAFSRRFCPIGNQTRLWPVAGAAGLDHFNEALLQPSDFGGWLTGNAGGELLKPRANDYLQTWPVSRRVNSSRAPGDDQTLVDRVAA